MHGFDEFYGNLYHLNAEEEPEHADYPKDPAFREKFGPRGVLDCKATDKDDPTVDPRFGKVGKQTIKDTGPLTKKRMETIDDDIAEPRRRLHQAAAAGRQAVLRLGELHPHALPHAREAGEHRPAGRWQSEYHDAMIDHDKNVGTVLKALDDLGIADDTFVMYSTDNGPHMNTWPDAAMTPFRNEKNSNWEGAYRVPCMVRWPGKIKPGQVSNEIVAHHDWLPTLAGRGRRRRRHGEAAQGLQGRRHDLQGPPRRLQPRALPDRARPRRARASRSSTCNDDQQVTGLRYDNWKLVFMEQRAPGHAARSGPSRSRPCACPRSSTCAPTRTSGPTSRRTPTTTG